ncbi:Fc.00g068100.m01.CDS01 [Cosmosporella sp. VM-42]
MTQPPTPGSRAPADDADFRFELNVTACEWGEAYHPGGYHPVNLGDIFNSRYRVIRKLGYGSYSTVWLAIDEQLQEYVALKIALANTPQVHIDRELSFYQLIKTHGQDRGASHLLELKDDFQHQGPNGCHPCFVYNPMGPNIGVMLRICPDFRYGQPWERRFTKDFSKQASRDILLGLTFLHQNDIVHADIQPGNILVSIPHIDVNPQTTASLKQSPDQGRPLVRLDGKRDAWAPSYLIEGKSLHDYTSAEMSPLVKIADLGAAFCESEHPSKIVTPVALRSPELILGLAPSRALDIWCFGCVLYELLTGEQLFYVEPLDEDEYDEETNDEHLIQIHETLDPLPQSLFKLWRRGSDYFDADGKRLNPPKDGGAALEKQDSVGSSMSGSDGEEPEDGPGHFLSLETRFGKNKTEGIDEAEEKELLHLIHWILEADSSKRPTAVNILEHPWFQS